MSEEAEKREGPPIPRDTGDDYATDIVPILLAEEQDDGPPRLTAFCGTGFRVGGDLLVTCWHCVAAEEPERGGYCIAVQAAGEFRIHPLLEIGRDTNAADLATARISDPEHLLPPARLSLASKGTITGSDVWTYGFPFMTVKPPETKGPRFILNGRLLRGYITRTFWYEHHALGRIPAYELDMLAPEGLSGAPLVYRPGDSVIGVIYGRHEVGLVDEFSRVDPETGAATPEIQRILSFGLACDTSTLFDVQTPATNGVRLFDHLNR